MLEGITVDTPQELVIAAFADRLGWTYQDITNTPLWLLETLLLKWKIEADHQAKEK